jgi:hypothetical protein
VVDLSGIDQLVALEAPDVEPVPFAAVEREPGDGQGFPLCTGLLDPLIGPSPWVDAVPDLRNDAFQAHLAGVRKHFRAIDFKGLAELDVGSGDDLLELGLSSVEG